MLAAGTGYYLYSSANSESKEVRYVTARAQKGPMATSVSASGSIIVDQLVNVDPQDFRDGLRFGGERRRQRKKRTTAFYDR